MQISPNNTVVRLVLTILLLNGRCILGLLNPPVSNRISFYKHVVTSSRIYMSTSSSDSANDEYLKSDENLANSYTKSSNTDDQKVLVNVSGKGFGKRVLSSQKETSKISTNKISTKPVEDVVIQSNVGVMEPIADVDKAILSTKLYKNKRLQQEAALNEKIRLLREEEELIASDPSVGAVPEIVANRMISRIAGFFGIPVFGGLSIFVIAFFVSKKYDIIIPPNLIAYATQVPFIAGLLGITYAILSSSWDDVS